MYSKSASNPETQSPNSIFVNLSDTKQLSDRASIIHQRVNGYAKRHIIQLTNDYFIHGSYKDYGADQYLISALTEQEKQLFLKCNIIRFIPITDCAANISKPALVSSFARYSGLGNLKTMSEDDYAKIIKQEPVNTFTLQGQSSKKYLSLNIGTGLLITDGKLTTTGTTTSPVSDINGIKGDYSCTHGIIDAPNGLVTYTTGTADLVVKAGIVLVAAGNEGTKTTIASDIKYSVKSNASVTLFYAEGEIIEADKVFYQEAEPEDGTTGYIAWYAPSVGKWKFKSNDTGNVFREAVATPIANVTLTSEAITRIDYIGYRILDDEIIATKADVQHNTTEIEENATNIGTLTNTVNANKTAYDKDKATFALKSEIPASSTFATAAQGTKADNATTALGGLKFVKTTQAAYDALATKDANTVYIITG